MVYSQSQNLAQLHTELGKDVLLLESFECVEKVSEPYQLRCVALTTAQNLNTDKLLHRAAAISLPLDTDNTSKIRWVHGIVRKTKESSWREPFYIHEITLVPQLWFLSLSSDSRVFQRLTTREIVDAVLAQHGISTHRWMLTSDHYIKRRYCVQYQETDLSFISRLLEEEGIHYYFEHTGSGHTLVLSDQFFSDPCPFVDRVQYHHRIDRQSPDDVVFSISRTASVNSKGVTLQDFDFKCPSNNLLSDYGDSGSGSDRFEHPGRYFTRAEGDHTARIRLEEIESSLVVFRGESNCRTFVPGHQFTLCDHFSHSMERSYRLLEVHHHLQNAPYFAYGDPLPTAESELIGRYENEFVAGMSPGVYRPPRVTPRPVMKGAQSATVVGPKGQEIHTDKYGRVKVQFHWDRKGRRDDNSSCWVRVSQPWAGKGWGTVAIPRIGQEVLVTFLEGDPDRPVIVGRLYNDEQMPPYPLPDQQNLMGFKSKSVQGNGYNEIVIDDTKDKELIRIHAQYNMDTVVEHDQRLHVKNDRSSTVDRDQKALIKGTTHLTVKGDQNEKCEGTISRQAGSDIEEKAGSNYAMEAGMEIHLKAGMNLVIESGTTLTLKAGGNFININPAGVFLSGTMVMINSGGAAGTGSGSTPQPPALPGVPPTLKSRVKPSSYSPAAQVLKDAAVSGTPFCEICSRK
jgi:type VI secretion system secreted protein VgrG